MTAYLFQGLARLVLAGLLAEFYLTGAALFAVTIDPDAPSAAAGAADH